MIKMALFPRPCCRSLKRILVIGVSIVTAIMCGLTLFQWAGNEGFFGLTSRLPEITDAGMPFLVRSATTKGQTCVHPKLVMWPQSMKALLSTKPQPLRCAAAGPNWVYVDNGTFRVSAQARTSHGEITCAYAPLERQTDMKVVEGATVADMRDGQRITSDFFKGRCRSSDGSYRDHLLSGVAYNAGVHARRPAPDKDAIPLNVLMLGFDSTSHMSWLRMLPRTHRYFTETLGGVVLESYNIVGDGTPQALLPILTGLNEMELPEARRGHVGAAPVDDHPWVWKQFRDAGYATQWGEDGAAFGTFQYRMLGFRERPVDHYMRPFYLEAESQYRRHMPYCIGSIPRHVNMLNWIRDFFDMYPRKPKFSFLFHSEFSHSGMTELQLADDDVLAFLRAMNARGHLNDTLLIMMADHGARFSNVRDTMQGKYEERMPYMGFRFPPWVERKYPEAMHNLRTNVHRLTTPYDIHATFLDILKYDSSFSKSESRNRSISLLKTIPADRTCAEAGIDAHWCTCLAWKAVATDDNNVKSAAAAVVRLINELTETKRHLCQQLFLANVTSAVRYTPSDTVMRYRGSKDHDGRVADLSGTSPTTEVFHQVTIVTTPGGGMYEATVKQDPVREWFTANAKEISRINKYGQQPHCVADQHPHLRQFCYCRVQLQ